MSQLTELRLDPTLCDAHGFCVEMLPEILTLDEWGYPLLASGSLVVAVPEHLVSSAKKAVAACPVAALRLVTHKR
ncbi:MAG: ferredoxin [Candidatus Nanopelagicales bacterium]